MEMVGDWNPRGGESLPRRSKLSGDASVTELTLPCAFVRKRGLPDSRFLCITHAATYTCARTVYTHTHTLALPSVSLSAYRRAHRAVRFPPSWPPRGPSLSTSVIQPWEQLHAPFGTVPFPRLSFFPSCSCIRLLRIQLIRKLSLSLSLSVRLEEKNLQDFVRTRRFHIGSRWISAMISISSMCFVLANCQERECFKQS